MLVLLHPFAVHRFIPSTLSKSGTPIATELQNLGLADTLGKQPGQTHRLVRITSAKQTPADMAKRWISRVCLLWRDCGTFGVGAQAVQKSDGCGHVHRMVFLVAQTQQTEYELSFTGTKESSAA